MEKGYLKKGFCFTGSRVFFLVLSRSHLIGDCDLERKVEYNFVFLAGLAAFVNHRQSLNIGPRKVN